MQISTFWQYILPQHAISKLLGKLARCKITFIKNSLIFLFGHFYKVDLNDAVEQNPYAYRDFQSYFTRALRNTTRPIPEDSNVIISPVDGSISQIGNIEHNTLIQAKGFSFSLEGLLANQQDIANLFLNGLFTTLYLSPADYHRVHMPCDGKLKKVIYIPGKLFAVNKKSSSAINNLYARNERVIALFETAIGPVAVILVGALIVAGIETVWSGKIAPSKERKITLYDYQKQNISLKRGDELGRFSFGSTVIMLFKKDSINWNKQLTTEQKIRLGQTFGKIINS